MRISKPLAALSAVLLLGGCAGSATPSAQSDPADLVGVTWLLTEVGGAEPVEGAPVSVRFGEDGTVSGSGGCNRFSGTYDAEPGSLSIAEDIASNMMACQDDVMAVEAALLKALPEATGFEVGDGSLTLTGTEPLATFKAQSQDLADTSWKVTGYLVGDGIVSPEADAELAFGTDGSISGTGGCNRLIGKFTASDDGTIGFDSVGSTQMACEEAAMVQEAAFIAALESTSNYLVEGDTLQLTAADGATTVTLTKA